MGRGLLAEQCWLHICRASPAGETHAGLKNARTKTAHPETARSKS